MKLDLTLSTAFTLRKRIKELEHSLSAVLQYAEFITEEEKVNEILENFEENSVEKTYELLNTCLELNVRLSNIIDEHNLEGKKILNELNTINTKINIFNRISSVLKGNRTSKSRNPVTGNWEVTKLVKITDYDAESELKKLNQQKVKLEDRLAQINTKEKFSFEIDDIIYNRIYGE